MDMTNTRFRWPFLLLLFVFLAAFPALGHDEAPAGVTTVVIVRHAEKADASRDTALSAVGKARAEALASALESAGVGAVYTTQFQRTRLTAEPLTRRLNLSVAERPVGEDVPAHARDLAREVLSKEKGKTVLIVGHSNTVPDLVKAFSGSTVAPLADEDYDQIFVVVVPSSGPARLFKTRYGVPGSSAGR
jgi:broad specificity phosphatase PhoE